MKKSDTATNSSCVRRALSSTRPAALFNDLVRSASELLGADIGVIGRYVEHNGVPSISTLAYSVDGKIIENEVCPLDGTPCETVVGHKFRFYPNGVAMRFPESTTKGLEVAGYAAFPLTEEDGSRLGVFCVMSRKPLSEPVQAEALLRIFGKNYRRNSPKCCAGRTES